MRIADLPSGADLGFTDQLRPGVGRAVGGRVGDCAVSFTGASLVPTVAPGVLWVVDTAGTFTGIAGSLLRQVLAAATALPALAVNSSGNPRVDLIVARAGNQWGGAPTLAVRQGAGTANANARNLLGAAALVAGDLPLLAITVPNGANPAAVAALANTSVAEDCRTLAGDLTPAGIELNFAGSTPPVGYKLEDGGDYNGRADGPWAEMVAAIGTAHGVPVAGRINLPNTIGRARVGSGPGGGNDDRGQAITNRGVGAKVGRESHPVATTEMPPHAHGGAVTGDGGHGHNMWTEGRGGQGIPNVGMGNGRQGVLGDQFAGAGGADYGIATAGGNGSFQWAIGVADGGGHGHGIASEGDGTAHPNMQPSIATPAIVKF
jgi:microcystin-dependent protein